MKSKAVRKKGVVFIVLQRQIVFDEVCVKQAIDLETRLRVFFS